MFLKCHVIPMMSPMTSKGSCFTALFLIQRIVVLEDELFCFPSNLGQKSHYTYRRLRDFHA